MKTKHSNIRYLEGTQGLIPATVLLTAIM